MWSPVEGHDHMAFKLKGRPEAPAGLVKLHTPGL